ncbi:RNA polymerase sigma factor [Parabacteroides goldsteinii]|uniref:RNA polymerase sigma factor n=1 Tax=Parabacteroides goldsteinii TaxID=328812 RepID=UPI001F5D1AE8|nr:sigma factor [Parabacteroides goldsteinii]
MKEIVQNRSASEQNTRVADIFRKYQAQLKGFISRRVSSKEDSEDILQNVFYQFMKYDQEDSPIEQIAAWLYSVARSQIIDRSRKHREEEMPYLSAEPTGQNRTVSGQKPTNQRFVGFFYCL